MIAWSCLRPLAQKAITNNLKCAVFRREMGGGHGPRTFPLQPSRWQWNRFKDLLHFYAMLGFIPITAIIMYANVFIGPAQLQEIPEDYVPKHWEYHSHPITRFLARYLFHNPQQEYEKYLHYLFEQDEKKKIRQLESQVKQKIAERHDYQAYYYRPILAKYHRASKETSDYLDRIRGD